MLLEALKNIEKGTGSKEFYMGREGNSLLEHEEVPSGYVPSWMAFLEQYRKEAQEPLEDTLDKGPDLETSVELPEEHPRIFRLFVHWLYTGRLVTTDVGLSKPCIYASLYGLAERLDVPELRHKCYSEFQETYHSDSDLPGDDLVGIVVNECSSKCALRIYLVQLFAHAIIKKSTTDTDNARLQNYPSFYDDIARKITQRLLAHEESRHPYEIKKSDESDYEVDTESVTPTSEGDSDFEMDHVMEISDDEEDDSFLANEEVGCFPANEEERVRLTIPVKSFQLQEAEVNDTYPLTASNNRDIEMIETVADEAESSTAENDDRGSSATDEEASVKSTQSHGSEESGNEDVSDSLDPENIMKTDPDNATVRKRKRYTSEEDKGENKENQKKKKCKDFVTVIDLLD